MPTLAARAASMLTRQMKAAHGVSVTYSRASTSQSVSLTAWVGRTVFASNNDGGPAVEFGERDYLISAADLVLGGSAVEPAEADIVTEAIAGVSVRFRVARPSTGEPAWRWSDQGRTVYRVHCTRVP